MNKGDLVLEVYLSILFACTTLVNVGWCLLQWAVCWVSLCWAFYLFFVVLRCTNMNFIRIDMNFKELVCVITFIIKARPRADLSSLRNFFPKIFCKGSR